MKKLLIRLTPGFFVFGMTCCGGTLADALGEADYTKYKAEQSKKIELAIRKK